MPLHPVRETSFLAKSGYREDGYAGADVRQARVFCGRPYYGAADAAVTEDCGAKYKKRDICSPSADETSEGPRPEITGGAPRAIHGFCVVYGMLPVSAQKRYSFSAGDNMPFTGEHIDV